jgi:hypothetical protein
VLLLVRPAAKPGHQIKTKERKHMSKNVKFLRKGVLFLAVLAMVIGQCFGVFGAVAEAAGADDYKVISVAWDETVPATLVKDVAYEINATVVLEDGVAHFLTGTEDTATNPSITLTAPEGGFTDVIAIKYRTNCGSYGSNYWGTFLLNGTAEFYGNRKDSDNWFYYYTDGEWDVLILDMRKHKQGSGGTPDTDVTGGAAIESLVYNFFDYTGNGGKLETYDMEEEYIDIGYIAFFENKDDAYAYADSQK